MLIKIYSKSPADLSMSWPAKAQNIQQISQMFNKNGRINMILSKFTNVIIVSMALQTYFCMIMQDKMGFPTSSISTFLLLPIFFGINLEGPFSALMNLEFEPICRLLHLHIVRFCSDPTLPRVNVDQAPYFPCYYSLQFPNK